MIGKDGNSGTAEGHETQPGDVDIEMANKSQAQPTSSNSTSPSKTTVTQPKEQKKLKMLSWLVILLALTTIGLLVAVIVLATDDDDDNKAKVAFPTTKAPEGDNICEGKKPKDPAFDNKNCTLASIKEQAGANVTKGYQGSFNTSAVPITIPYFQAGLCPINVHWHLGAEHYSKGEYDESGSGPTEIVDRRRLGGKTREGYQCKHYDAKDEKFTKGYNWEHCKDMEVGQTYEVHWPHSALGACGTLNQYQTPFYDGVFCGYKSGLSNTAAQIGVQAQVFTIVNDEKYYFPDLMRGMIVDNDDGIYGTDLAMYTGSTTGTTRNNKICSAYTPITWQVDRKCHLVSASSFDKMCADMKAQRDDMSDDLHPHGSRELVSDDLAANNQVP